ncbi:unnamed protein product [Sympodiomycopsis kandeliae]
MRLPTTVFILLALAMTIVVASAIDHTLPITSGKAFNPSFGNGIYNQTANYNLTVFVVKIDKGSAKELAGGKSLLPVQGLPDGYLTEEEHPIIFLTGSLSDYRQGPFKADQALAATIKVPFVDGSNDGQTPFTFDSLIVQDQIDTVLVAGPLHTINLQAAKFDPKDKAWKSLDNGLYSQSIGQGSDFKSLNKGTPLSNLSLINAVWKPVDQKCQDECTQVSSQFFKGVIDAPYIRTYSGTCSKTTYDYNQSFAQPFYVKGDLEIFPPGIPRQQNFTEVPGFHVATGWLNEFGRGKKCEEYRDFANSIKYS